MKDSKFKVGDRVRCINSSHSGLELDMEYAVTGIHYGGDGIALDRMLGIYDVSRFQFVDEPEKRVLTLKYGSVGIDLDPSIPFSRKFAEMFLKIVYEETQ
jgi:hypothetical protein